MRALELSSQFKKDLKRLAKQHAPLDKLNAVIMILQCDKQVSEGCRDHQLVCNWCGYRELHITPNFLLIYRKTDDGVLRLAAAGSHAELYGK